MERKYCSGCNQERDIEDFRWKIKGQKRQAWCKCCQAEANKVHYQNNKQSYLDRAKARNSRLIEENQRRLYIYLSQHPCVDCGQTDVRVLEFDHVRGKKMESIARLVRLGISWATIEDEIAKCEVRCANCHRIKTNERGKWWRFRRE
jgi:Zn finger protein HypA/HybF involved in hydrogenase expression